MSQMMFRDKLRKTHAALLRLQKEIRAGRSVFFIGAGMSIDSEGNSAERIVIRLLIRLCALHRAALLQPRGSVLRRLAEVQIEDFDNVFRRLPKPLVSKLRKRDVQDWEKAREPVGWTKGIRPERQRRIRCICRFLRSKLLAK